MKTIIERLGFLHAVLAAIVSAATYLLLISLGPSAVPAGAAFFVPMAILQAASLSLAATRPGREPWRPVFRATQGRVTALRVVLAFLVLMVGAHGLWWMAGRGSVSEFTEIRRATTFFAAVGVLTSVVLLSHWGLSSSAVLPGWIRTLGEPWIIWPFLSRKSRQRMRRANRK